MATEVESGHSDGCRRASQHANPVSLGSWTLGLEAEAWFHKKPSGCINGQACKRCHLCPEGEPKLRKKQHLGAFECSFQDLLMLFCPFAMVLVRFSRGAGLSKCGIDLQRSVRDNARVARKVARLRQQQAEAASREQVHTQAQQAQQAHARVQAQAAQAQVAQVQQAQHAQHAQAVQAALPVSLQAEKGWP